TWDPAEFEHWYDRLPLGEHKRKAWENLTASQRKLWTERWNFRQFARVAPLSINPHTIKSCNPTGPDLVCEIADQLYYFELGEVTDEALARGRSVAAKEGKNISGGSFLQIEPLCRIFDQKCGKGYTAGTRDVHLLLYYSTDRQVPYT